jgi:hypothetical protein
MGFICHSKNIWQTIGADIVIIEYSVSAKVPNAKLVESGLCRPINIRQTLTSQMNRNKTPRKLDESCSLRNGGTSTAE